MKTCSKCRINKEFSDFNKCKNGKFGLHNHCRECQRICRNNWYNANKTEERKKSSEYAKSPNGIDVRLERYKKNKDKILESNRIRRKTPEARKLANIARQKIYNTNISFRISVNLRSRIRLALKGKTKLRHSNDFLGCTLEEFKLYIESKFIDGMTWDNYGKNGWHIDHIRPCNSFNLTDIKQQQECFHFSNMQPLWWQDNLSKGSRYEPNIKND